MGRILVLAVALLLPLAIYAVWINLVRRKQRLAAEGQLPPWQDWPWTWLTIAGVVLLIATLVGLYAFGIDPDDWIGGESLVKH